MKPCNETERFEVCLKRRHAELCGVFANATRLEILLALGEQELNAGELAERVGVSAANLSQHMRVMRDQLAVRVRKDGRNVYYRVANPNFLEAVRLVRTGLMEEIRLQHEAAERMGL